MQAIQGSLALCPSRDYLIPARRDTEVNQARSRSWASSFARGVRLSPRLHQKHDRASGVSSGGSVGSSTPEPSFVVAGLGCRMVSRTGAQGRRQVPQGDGQMSTSITKRKGGHLCPPLATAPQPEVVRLLRQLAAAFLRFDSCVSTDSGP